VGFEICDRELETATPFVVGIDGKRYLSGMLSVANQGLWKEPYEMIGLCDYLF
jgi:hypothetical protein